MVLMMVVIWNKLHLVLIIVMLIIFLFLTFKMVEKGIDECNEKYGSDVVKRVIQRMKNSEFKRKRLPIIIERS